MGANGPSARPRAITLSEVAQRILAGEGPLHLLDAQGSSAAAVVAALRQRTDRPVLVVTEDADSVTQNLDDLSAFATGLIDLPGVASEERPPALVSYDVSDGSPYAERASDRRREMARTSALVLFLSGASNTLVLPARALWRKCVPYTLLAAHTLTLREGDTLELDRVAAALSVAGYARAPLVEEPGELAVRGGLLDVWPAGRGGPVRVELDADRIVSLKDFDPETQKSHAPSGDVTVPPAREVLRDAAVIQRAERLVQSLCDAVNFPTLKTRALLEDLGEGRLFFGAEALLPAYYELAALTDLLPKSTIVVLEEPSTIVRALRVTRERAELDEARVRDEPRFPLSSLYVDEATLVRGLNERTLVITHRTSMQQVSAKVGELETFEGAPPDAPALDALDHRELKRATEQARGQRGYEAVLDPLEEELKRWATLGFRTTLVARTATQADRWASLLSHRGVTAPVVDTLEARRKAAPASLTIAVAPLARGARFNSEGVVLLTEEEIFGKRRHQERRTRRGGGLGLDDLRSLKVDDYVVHVEHGIGRYKGLEHRNVGDVWLDLLVVEYLGGDKLFLPVYRLNQIQKHTTSDGHAKLDRLGGQTFARTKAKVRRRVREMADELLRLYAERKAVTRPALPPPGDEYSTFEAEFPFEETPDQAGAILDVISDLGRDIVMDRLVCGDVGFGKTEVALRAAFLNVMNGRQVALLCPTTVLAQQHYLTFKTRFAEYPVDVRVLSRFQQQKEVSAALAALKNGSADVVVGTHRLLSKDVHFKNLGLLIVDEEQRFGVTHKERIKQLRHSVDVLTLSATPIPRTLQMAVSGIRDLSMISTPPSERRGIRTIVSKLDDSMIRSAVERELERGGQVFYVYNRIEGLDERAAHLKMLVPGLRVAVAHGQQVERELERVMLKFIRGDFDVLCSTAIIESGLDIPRANTMIIDRADLMGLSQLYQLRGRVGRSHQQAYCYLMVPPPSRMTDEARARVEAMQRYSELGSGFQIASMDMEIRGAGDLLGAEQSGFVQTVGFELFCQMLHEATEELSGHTTSPEIDPELSVDVEALIPEDYVDDVGVRLSLYKRLASAGSADEVTGITNEIVDRFGPPPNAVRRLAALMQLKVELRALRALGCEATAERVTLHLNQDTPLSAESIMTLVASEGARFTLTPTGRFTRRASPDEHFESGLDHASHTVAELRRRTLREPE
ncbi:MAG TPA: transcription-repair coupling factor [Polyangiaceae bacterium]|nr:transcription-repair coupling factor [Polyangiaceae bacterium]